jgi:hypothetical protein
MYPTMTHIHLGTTLRSKQSLNLPLNKLCKHTAIVGASGSGKSGLLLGIAEQQVENNIPTILVDLKGDMSNILLQKYGSSIKNRMRVRMLTPGGDYGTAIDLFASLERKDRIKAAVSQILHLCGYRRVNPLSSKEHAYLSIILGHLHKEGTSTDLMTLMGHIMRPPFEEYGSMSVNSAVPEALRTNLVQRINNMYVAPSFAKWRDGIDLDIGDLFNRTNNGRTNVTIYNVSHLDDQERIFALSLLFSNIITWMRTQRGSEDLVASLIVDECVGIIPPHPANPDTKPPLMIMLKQARAYGLGLILASQNPMDLDYKAMSNCETWMVGRLQMKNDRKRVIQAICEVSSQDRAVLEKRIAQLSPREFVLCRPKSTADFVTADVKCDLVGPMTALEIQQAL